MNTPVSLLLAFAGGLAIAIQARITGALKVEIGDGATAAAMTFGTGFAFMLVVNLATKANRRAVARMFSGARERRFPPVFLLSGLMGGYAVFGQGVTVDLIGVAIFSLTFIAGQLISSIAIDSVGWVPSGKKRMTKARIFGTVLAVIGIAIAVVPRVASGGSSDAAGTGSAAIFVAILLVFSAGLIQPPQMAMNGVVGAVAVTPGPVALTNYLTGTSLLVVLAWPALTSGVLTRLPTGWENWWYYAGGFLGVVVIIGGTLLTRTIGSLMFTLGVVAGQICGSLTVDAIWPVPGAEVTIWTVTGGLLTVVAVAIAAGRSPRGGSV